MSLYNADRPEAKIFESIMANEDTVIKEAKQKAARIEESKRVQGTAGAVLRFYKGLSEQGKAEFKQAISM